MSRTIQTVTKWLQPDTETLTNTYQNCRDLKKTATNLLLRINIVLENLKKKYNAKIHHNCLQNELNIQVRSAKYFKNITVIFIGAGRY